MPIRGLELGNRRPIILRAGNDGFAWGGMYLEGNPGTVPANRLRHAENVRLSGGSIRSRGGLSIVNADPIHDADAKILDLQDFQARTRRMYPLFTGCPGLSTTIGFSASWYDTDQSPTWQRGLYYNSASGNIVAGVYDGQLYIGIDDTLKVLKLIKSPYGEDALAFAGFEQAEHLHRFTGFTIRALEEFDGKLFIGLDAGAGSSKIAVYDGLTIHDGTQGTTADLTGIDPPARFCRIRDKLAVGFTTNPSGIRLRNVGDVPGTWGALIAGALATQHMASYKDNLYITDGSTAVWRYNFSALATVRTIVGATIYGLTTYNDGAAQYLFYGYQSAGNAAIIGRYDGSSFVDAHYNITAAYSEARLPRVLKSYRGSLAALTNTLSSGGRLYLSKGNDTDGTVAYARVIQPNSGASGALDMVIF